MTKNKYFDSFFLGTVLMCATYFIAMIFGWIDPAKIMANENHEILEIFAVYTSYICTLLCVMQSRWNYPIGIITTAAYSYLFFQWNLPSVAWFNLYLVGSLTYGWFRWRSDDETLPVSLVFEKPFWYLGYVALGLAVYCFLIVVNNYFGYETTALDAGIAVFSGVAQFLLDNKKLETWLVWIVVNVLSIKFYFSEGLYLVTIQYIYFLGNAFIGAWFWYRSMKNYDTAAV